ncbi:unnamed protein product [Jaminaea pallidilutea]
MLAKPSLLDRIAFSSRPASILERHVASFVVLLTLVAVLSNGSAYTVAHEQIAEEFSIDEVHFTNLYWPVTSWALGGGIFGIVVVPLMEDHGCFYPMIASWLGMIVFIIPQAVATNFATIIVTRFLTGGFVGIIAASAITVITSYWQDPKIRGVYVGGYMAAYLIGSSIGPVIGAAILHRGLDWRWIFWIQAIYLAFWLLPMIWALRAMPASTSLVEESIEDVKQESVGRMVLRAMRLLATEPIVTSCTCWSAFLLGTIYLFTQSVEQVFGTLYGWDATQAGFVQAAVVVGEICAVPCLFLTNSLYWQTATNHDTDGLARDNDTHDSERSSIRSSTPPSRQIHSSASGPQPQSRLYLALPGGLIGVTGGMLVYAWTSSASLPWIAPAIGLAMVGWGSVTVVNCVASYVVDAYASVAGSAMTAFAMGENSFIAFLPLAAQPMYGRLGVHWASFLLACVSLVLSMVPLFVFWKTTGATPLSFARARWRQLQRHRARVRGRD